MNNDKDKFIQFIDNDVKLNIKHNNGKLFFTKIIGICAKTNREVVVILESDKINIKQIIFNTLKKNFKYNIENEIYQFMLRCFIVVTEKQYERLTQNNKYPLLINI